MTPVLPTPTTAFELRRHLTTDHRDDRWGGNWTELHLLHTEAHTTTAAAGHTHEPPA